MKRLALLMCGTFFVAATATEALAADMPRKAPAYKAPVYIGDYGFSWSGFYVGINGGYSWGKSDFSSTLGSGGVKPSGALAGGTIGYNLQSGRWVFGVEGDFDANWARGTDNTAGTFCAGGIGCEGKSRWFATARGRLGYAADRLLPYITGGAAFADEKLTVPAALSASTTKVGWTLGGGVEYAFMGPWSAKIEYLYADLGKWTCGAATCGAATDVSLKTNIVRAGLNYRF